MSHRRLWYTRSIIVIEPGRGAPVARGRVKKRFGVGRVLTPRELMIG